MTTLSDEYNYKLEENDSYTKNMRFGRYKPWLKTYPEYAYTIACDLLTQSNLYATSLTDLIEAGVMIDRKFPYKLGCMTLIQVCCSLRHFYSLRYLIAADADVNVLNEKGYTLLDIIIRSSTEANIYKRTKSALYLLINAGCEKALCNDGFYDKRKEDWPDWLWSLILSCKKIHPNEKEKESFDEKTAMDYVLSLIDDASS